MGKPNEIRTTRTVYEVISGTDNFLFCNPKFIDDSRGPKQSEFCDELEELRVQGYRFVTQLNPGSKEVRVVLEKI